MSLQPSPETSLPSSHSSSPTRRRSPHFAATHRPPVEGQFQPDSATHVPEQPSPEVVLRSSHSSEPSTLPLPQIAVWVQGWPGTSHTHPRSIAAQDAEHPSPLTVLPSSHASAPCLRPSPHRPVPPSTGVDASGVSIVPASGLPGTPGSSPGQAATDRRREAIKKLASRERVGGVTMGGSSRKRGLKRRRLYLSFQSPVAVPSARQENRPGNPDRSVARLLRVQRRSGCIR